VICSLEMVYHVRNLNEQTYYIAWTPYHDTCIICITLLERMSTSYQLMTPIWAFGYYLPLVLTLGFWISQFYPLRNLFAIFKSHQLFVWLQWGMRSLTYWTSTQVDSNLSRIKYDEHISSWPFSYIVEKKFFHVLII
jgi:hypothetical protein